MNFVEPIQDRKKIAQIKHQIPEQHPYRDLLLLVVGINSALRISDLLTVRVEHLLDDQNRIKLCFWIKEQKRGKRQEVVINSSLKDAWKGILRLILKSSVTKTTSFSSIQRLMVS